MMAQPPWMCNNPNCAFRNRLLADAKLTTPHVCTQQWPIPIYINPFPPVKPITILPPPPLVPPPPTAPPPPPGPFYLVAPTNPLPVPPPFHAVPGPPAPIMHPGPVYPGPMPPGPPMLSTAPTPPAVPAASPAPPPGGKEPSMPASEPDKKPPSIEGVVHKTVVHTFKPKKGPISKDDKEALSDFEERTRRQEYLALTESSKEQPSPEQPKPILKHRPRVMPTVNQEVRVNVYNGTCTTKAQAKGSANESSKSSKSEPAKDAASVREEEAIKRAHSLAKGTAKATAPIATMSGALLPPSVAGSHAPSKSPSHASARGPSHVSNPAPATAAGTAPSRAPSTTKTPSRHGTSAPSPTPNPNRPTLALIGATANANANARLNPPSIHTWRQNVRDPITLRT